MSKIATDFGSFVNDKTFERYAESKATKLEEDDIVDLFLEFTKVQQKQTLGTQSYVRTWIDEWCALFPAGIKSGGKMLRSHPTDCLAKMTRFVKKYKYDRDLIFFSTREYLKDRALDDYNFTRCATYFIDKLGVGSTLAEWCEKCKDFDLTVEHARYDITSPNEFI